MFPHNVFWQLIIEFVSEFPHVGGVLRVLPFPLPIKLHDRHDITEILFKVTLNTINQPFCLTVRHVDNKLDFCSYHLAIPVHGGLLVPWCIIHPVVRVYALTWFIWCIYSWNLLFLNKRFIEIWSHIFYCFFLSMEWVSDCCLTPTQQFFNCIMARTIPFSMKWWWGPLCTRTTRLVL